ncbi:MAG: hypothetical protein QNL96_06010 [SAR86 cluster bacterium]
MSAPDLVALESEKTLEYHNFRHYLFARFFTTLAVQMQCWTSQDLLDTG